MNRCGSHIVDDLHGGFALPMLSIVFPGLDEHYYKMWQWEISIFERIFHFSGYASLS